MTNMKKAYPTPDSIKALLRIVLHLENYLDVLKKEKRSYFLRPVSADEIIVFVKELESIKEKMWSEIYKEYPQTGKWKAVSVSLTEITQTTPKL